MSNPVAGVSFSCLVSFISQDRISFDGSWSTALGFGNNFVPVTTPAGTAWRVVVTDAGTDDSGNPLYRNEVWLEGTRNTPGTIAWAYDRVYHWSPYTYRTVNGSLTIESAPDEQPRIGATRLTLTVGVSANGVTVPGGFSGDAPLTHTIVDDLPDGLSYAVSSGNFVLSGTPTTPQAATDYRIRVTDNDGDTDEDVLTIEIHPETVYVFDRLRNVAGAMRTEMQRLAMSSLATVFVAPDGALVAQGRSWRQSRQVAVTFDDARLIRAHTSTTRQRESDAPNSIRVWYHPRELEDDVTLWSLFEAVRIPTYQHVEFGITFTDPDVLSAHVAASDLEVDGVSATSGETGGADRTSAITATIVSSGPTWAVVRAASSHVGTVWLRSLDVTGRIYRSYDDQWAQSSDADDIAATGERRLDHFAPYALSQAAAQQIADTLLSIYHSVRPEIPVVEQFVGESDGNLLDLDLGDRVRVLETGTGFDEICSVERISWDIPEDGVPRIRFGLSFTPEVR